MSASYTCFMLYWCNWRTCFVLCWNVCLGFIPLFSHACARALCALLFEKNASLLGNRCWIQVSNICKFWHSTKSLLTYFPLYLFTFLEWKWSELCYFAILKNASTSHLGVASYLLVTSSHSIWVVFSKINPRLWILSYILLLLENQVVDVAVIFFYFRPVTFAYWL